MVVNAIRELSPAEAVEILRANGSLIGLELLKAGIEQGVFPFGVYVQMGRKQHIIFRRLLMEWIAERAEPEYVPEYPEQEEEEA